jgi:DivIVA domain-containing protein
MGQVLLLVVVALTVAAVVFGVTVLVTGGDSGLGTAEPDGRSVPLPGTRPLMETDVAAVRFDTTVRGYRMAQVDQALRRAAYDIGYKDELIGVLEAEVTALREGRASDADTLRRAREAALVPAGAGVGGSGGYGSPAAGLVDLGDVSGPREDKDAEDDDAVEGVATATAVAVPGAVVTGTAVTADEVMGDDTDDEVDTDATDTAGAEVDEAADATDEADEADETDDATDSDARRTLPDRDERA